MKKTIVAILIPLFAINLFASLKEDHAEAIKKLKKKSTIVSTEKELIDFKKKVEKVYIELIEKNKGNMNNEEKILAARMYNEINMPDKALSFLKQVKINKENKNYYYATLGQTYFLLGKFNKSINAFKKINYSQPRVALDFVNVGFGLIKKEKYKLAENVFKTILSKGVNNINVRYFAALGLMEAMELQNKPEDGIGYFKSMLKEISDKNEKTLIDNVESQLELIGKPFKEIKDIVLTFNKQDISIASNKGKYIMLFFFSGRSIGSVMAFPYIDGIYNKHKNKLEVIGINLFPKKVDFQKQKKFFTWYIMQNKKIKYPVAIVGKDLTYREYRVYTLPHFVIIGPDGKIDSVFIGFPAERFNPLLSYIEKIAGKKR